MKKISVLIALLISLNNVAQVGIGTTNPDVSSLLDISSTTKGFLQPRMTSTQRGAIVTPTVGLQVYDLTTKSNWFFDGNIWIENNAKFDRSKWTNDSANTRVRLTNLSDGVTARPSGKEFVVNDAGNVGLGTTTPANKIDINGGATVGTGTGRATFNTWWAGNTAFWIDLPTTGPSGIGFGGAGANAMMSYCQVSANWFADALAGDVASRNLTGKLLFGNTSGNAAMAISGDKVGIGTVNPTSKLQVVGLTVHANNAAAKTAGLTVGAFYHNGDGIVRVVF